MATCVHTGQQRLACGAIGPLIGQEPHDCGHDIWMGEPHGYAECRRYGLWVYCPPTGSPVPCGPDHPDAIPNMNALIRNGVWDRQTQTWVLLDGVVRD